MAVEDSRRALITYALVGEALESTNDFLTGLAPIFAAIAVRNHGKMYNPKEFSEEVDAAFGLHIPEEVCDFFAPRLQKVGLLRRLAGDSNSITYTWDSSSSATFSANSQIETKIDLVITEFQEFSKSFPSLTALHFERTELEDGLFNWILRDDRNVRSAMSALGYDPDAKPSGPTHFRDEAVYLAASFVKSLQRSNSGLLDFLAEIANSVIVSEALVGVSDPKQAPTQRADLFLYLDAPFAMDVLNLTGRDRREYALELVSGMKKLGCNIVMFQHSVDELQDNLRALLSAPRRYGPTADAILRGEVTEAYAKYVLSNTEDIIRDAEIAVYDVDRISLPPSTERFFDKSKEDRLYQLLQAHYESSRALDRDIRSISLIMKRRSGHSTSAFLRSKHLLVTGNAIISAAAHVINKEMGNRPDSIGPALHRRRMAAALWLQFGSEKRRAIARKRLIASCSDVLQVNPNIVDRVRSRLAQISPESAEQYDIIIRQPRYQQLAMDLTFASEAVAANADANVLFEKLKMDMVTEERIKSAKRRSKDRREYKEALNQLSDKAASVERDARVEKERAEAAQMEMLRLLNASIGKMFSRATRWLRYAPLLAGLLSLLIFIIGVVTSYLNKNYFGDFAGAFAILCLVLGVLLAGLTIFGGSVWLLRHPIERCWEWKVRAALRRLGYDNAGLIALHTGRVDLGDGRVVLLGEGRGLFEIDKIDLEIDPIA